MKDRLEILFWRIALRILERGYGYCAIRCDDPQFMGEGRCAGCDASDVQDWIRKHIELIER